MKITCVVDKNLSLVRLYLRMERRTFVKMPRLLNSNPTFQATAIMRSLGFTDISLSHLVFHCGNC